MVVRWPRRSRVLARTGSPIRRRRILASTGVWHWWERRPKLSGDHAFDLMPDDFARRPTVYISPECVHLAAMLTGFSPERRRVLAESESGNGWPAWWERRFYSDSEEWETFKAMCLEALENFHTSGIPIENTLYVCAQEIENDAA
jgi:hypothetical protein